MRALPALAGGRPVPPAALALIERFEGFSGRPYVCPAGYWTIGFGRLCAPDHPEITRAEARRYLEADAALAADAVARLICVPLSEGELGALVSFTFNLGAGALQASTLRRRLNAGNRSAAADEFPRWVHASGRVLPGLVRRRTAERAMFLEG